MMRVPPVVYSIKYYNNGAASLSFTFPCWFRNTIIYTSTTCKIRGKRREDELKKKNNRNHINVI